MSPGRQTYSRRVVGMSGPELERVDAINERVVAQSERLLIGNRNSAFIEAARRFGGAASHKERFRIQLRARLISADSQSAFVNILFDLAVAEVKSQSHTTQEVSFGKYSFKMTPGCGLCGGLGYREQDRIQLVQETTQFEHLRTLFCSEVAMRLPVRSIAMTGFPDAERLPGLYRAEYRLQFQLHRLGPMEPSRGNIDSILPLASFECELGPRCFSEFEAYSGIEHYQACAGCRGSGFGLVPERRA
jgi:hypothetical protein